MGSFRPSPRPSPPFLSSRASCPAVHRGLCAGVESSTCPRPSPWLSHLPSCLQLCHFPLNFPVRLRSRVCGGAGEMTTQTQLARADSLPGRCSQARAWLVQRAAGYFYLSLFSESMCCMDQTSASKATGHRAALALAKLHPLQKPVRAAEGSQVVSTDMDSSPIPHYMAAASLDFARCWCPVSSPAAPVHPCSRSQFLPVLVPLTV